MRNWKTNRRTGTKYPLNAYGQVPLEELSKLDKKVRHGAVKSSDFPRSICFDWNGTIDARGTGLGIPLEAVVALKQLGKNVIIFSSSVRADKKLFMRKVCEANGLPYTDNPHILRSTDMYVADKKSDEKRAGKYGVTFVWTKDFDLLKVLPKKCIKDVEALTKTKCNCETCQK